MKFEDYKIAFVGLPSSGKSSIINSLAFKRILQSGMCRTTTEVKILDEDIEDDIGNKFQVIDLPGICDSEETKSDFTKLTYEHIESANLIIWVTDINKAFITSYEVDEYNKLKNHIDKLSTDTGKLYYVMIMISKCNQLDKKSKSPTANIIKYIKGEIANEEEDTNIHDVITKVKDKFPQDDVILFNAFGRSYYNKKSSETLKNFVAKIGIPNDVNTTFNIKKYYQNYKQDQDIKYYDRFKNIFDKYILEYNNNDLFKVISAWNNVRNNLQKNFIDIIVPNNTNNISVKHLKFITTICNNTPLYYNNINMLLLFIENYIYVIDNNKILELKDININTNLPEPYKQLYVLFIDKFTLLPNKYQIRIHKLLLTTSDYIRSNFHACEILKLIYEVKSRYELDFTNIYLEFITEYKDSECGVYKIFYDKVMYTLTTIYKFVTDETKDIDYNIEVFQQYLLYLYDTDDFILLNKLEILLCIYNKTQIECTYKKILTTSLNISYTRLLHNNNFKTIINNIWLKIYSNIKLSFDYDNYNDFVPYSVLELL